MAGTSSLWPRWSVAVQTPLFESPKHNATLLVILLSIFLRMSFCLSSWDLRIKAGPVICDGGFRRDHKACSAEQWPSTCQSAALCCGAEAEARGFLCLSGWAGLRFYQCVQSSMKVIWHDFFIYVSSEWQGFGFEGEEEEAAKEEQRSRFGRS